MEEEASGAAKQAATAIDYTNPDQLIILVQEQGTDLGMKLLAAVAIFFNRPLAR